jgi:hypothetical protein
MRIAGVLASFVLAASCGAGGDGPDAPRTRSGGGHSEPILERWGFDFSPPRNTAGQDSGDDGAGGAGVGGLGGVSGAGGSSGVGATGGSSGVGATGGVGGSGGVGAFGSFAGFEDLGMSGFGAGDAVPVPGNSPPLAAFRAQPRCADELGSTLQLVSTSVDPDDDALRCQFSIGAGLPTIADECVVDVQLFLGEPQPVTLIVDDGHGGVDAVTMNVGPCTSLPSS